jgi:hypothetical protein
MPYCAPSENGTQCQTCSCDPSFRGSRLPDHPGISSFVRRGANRGSFRRYLTLCKLVPFDSGPTPQRIPCANGSISGKCCNRAVCNRPPNGDFAQGRDSSRKVHRVAYHQAAVAIFSRTALELRQLAKVLVGQRDSMRVEQLATATLVLAFSATMILMASFFSAKRSKPKTSSSVSLA